MPVTVVLEDSDLLRNQILKALAVEGFEVSSWRDCAGAVEFVRRKSAGLLIVGAVAGDFHASLEAIRELKSLTGAPAVFIPALSSEEVAIAALRLPVQEYLPRPAAMSDIVSAADRLLARGAECSGIVGAAQAVVRIKSSLQKIASANCNTLITGETGTGKELVAEQIHSLGSRRERPFVAVNCAAIPDTLLESELFGYERGAFTGAARRTDGLLHAADGGTLFLDEIGDMSLVAQSKVLRAIETGKVRRVGTHVTVPMDVRVIAATNQNLENMIEDGRFRPDLYFRINVARLDLPSLRERPEDIPILVRHFLAQSAGRRIAVADDATALLLQYGWPGNIRELRNVIQATLVYLSGSVIHAADLPEFFLRKAAAAAGPSPSERNRLLAVLEQTDWNKSRAAESLQWSRMTLYRKMAKYQVSIRPVKSAAAATVKKASA